MRAIRVLSIIWCFSFSMTSFSQNWLAGGNPLGGPNGVNGVNNILGPNANFPLRIQTNGIPRMIIFNGGVGPNNGQVVLGNNIPVGFNPQARLHLHQTGGFNFLRATTNATGFTATDGFAAGINNTGFTFFTNFENNRPFAWYTEDASGTGTVQERMRINADNRNGFISMGETNNFLAEAQLHINNVELNNGGLGSAFYGNLFRTDGNEGRLNRWSMYTGTPALTTEKFNLMVPANTSNMVVNCIIPNSNMLLQVNNNRMFRITSAFGTGNNNLGQVLIQPNSNNAAVPVDTDPLVNLGGSIRFSEDLNVVPGNVSTLYYGYTNISGVPNGDGFRVKFGENTQGANNDCLVFEKTDAGPGTDPDGCIQFTNTGMDGIEELAMTIEGNGHVGVGHLFTQAEQPWRRFTAYDADFPQLRLSRTHDPTISNEVFTDFETTPTGDLNIDPRNAGLGVANVGSVRINYGFGNPTPHPNVSLDVNGQMNLRTVNPDVGNFNVLVWDPVTGNIRVNNTIGGGGAVTADNGLTTNPANNVQLGQDIGAVGNPGQLLNNREIPMIDKNIYLLGQNTNSGLNSLAIGYPGGFPLVARLNILQQAPVPVGSGTIGSFTENRDIPVIPAANQAHIGVCGGASGTHPIGSQAINIGIKGYAQNGAINRGIWGIVVNNSNPNATGNIAGYFQSLSLVGNNTGMQADAIGNPSAGQVFGVDATAAGSTTSIQTAGIRAFGSQGLTCYGGRFGANGGSVNNYGVYTSTPILAGTNYALYVDGDAFITGTDNFASDSILKTNVQNVTNATNIITQLVPKTFEYRDSDFPNLNLDQGMHYGLLAQDAELIIPEIVSSATTPPILDSNNIVIHPSESFKTLRYTELIPLLIAGFNEQQEIINSQDSMLQAMQQQVNDMMGMINSCCSNQNSMMNLGDNESNTGNTNFQVHTNEVKLGNRDCVLDQNSPNPFKESTTITYTIPEKVQFAQFVFYNNLGQIIKVMDINERGEGRLNVFAEDLRSGMYTYTLVMDGNVCETKKMIKE